MTQTTTPAPGPSPAVPARHPVALAALGATLLCALVWSGLAITHPGLDADYFWRGAMMAAYLAFALTGAFVLVNREARGLGTVLLASGALEALRQTVALTAEITGSRGAVLDLTAVVHLAAETVTAFMLMAFPLWLPAGRLPRGPWAAATVLTGLCALGIGFRDVAEDAEWATGPNPLRHGLWGHLADGLDHLLGSVSADISVDRNVFVSVIAVNLLIAAARRLRSPGPHRGLVEVTASYLVWIAIVTLPYYLHVESTWLLYTLVLTGQAGWLLGIAAGFRRDRSLFLDRATRRYLSAYAFGALLFAAVLALAFAAHQLLPVDDRTTATWWWTVLAAGALGALLHPAARGVLRAVDRYYYGERARPYQVARDLAERMSHTVDPARTPPLLCATVVGPLGFPAASVRLDARSGHRELAAAGHHGPYTESYPLTYEGQPIGELRVSPRAGEARFDRQDREVLRMLADQASPAVASLRLYEDLQAGRKRIVLAREEERRRLRHDLHDGLGPALSGLRLQVDAARSGVPDDSPAAAALGSASFGIGRAITELRRITDGLAPAALDSEGLTGALRRLAETLGGRALEVTVDLDPDPLPPLPAAVEVALYRISGEALNNVVRHSGATSVRLVLRVGPDEVSVEAQDNGAGFPTHSDGVGVGLRSMAERAEELGGSFSAANDPQGAVVRAVLPRASVLEQSG